MLIQMGDQGAWGCEGCDGVEGLRGGTWYATAVSGRELTFLVRIDFFSRDGEDGILTAGR